MVGRGVLKGMWLVLREFLSTYPLGRMVLRVTGQPAGNRLVTVQYPDEKQQHAERFRYFPFLVYDQTPDNLRCVACKICEQECPPQCIHIVGPAKDEQGRPLKVHGRTYPVEFDIDTSICMSCRICVDVCPFDAIEMDNQYEMSSTERFGEMAFNKEKLLKSNEYFQQIKPTEASVVDQRLEAKKPKPAPTQPPTPPSAA
ncbi:MAG: 4Fe-4S ferredoxin [Candidatus Omnitrophica bacterium CG11_big_fil_rev_8_21_14_0_20_63_9]|nr:MAG: 4Fe-4S ferredoxin [Candidatus Omnitrophica bacterium CG11_big_fil_rev_8_21_14_0_20_63_9]